MPNYEHIPPKNNRPGKKFPLWPLIILFLFSPGFAFALFILRMCMNGGLTVDSAKNEMRDMADQAKYEARTIRSRVSTYGHARPSNIVYEETIRTTPRPEPKPQNTHAQPQRSSAPAQPTKDGKVGGGQLVLAWIVIVIGALISIGCFSEMMDSLGYMAMGIFEPAYDLMPFIGNILTMAGGAVAAWGGLSLRRLVHLRNTLKKAVGNRKFLTLKDIAGILRCNEKTATKVAEASAKAGDLGSSAYVDYRADALVIDPNAPGLEDLIRRNDPFEMQRETAGKKDAEEGSSQYQDILRQLRQVNDAIPGEEMTAKISRLEDISAKIFDLAEKDPAKVPQLRKFLNYYLPTSLKLLTTYAQLDAQGVEGDNIRQSKRQIENTMDTLCDAFAAQLDKLFTSDAIDVSTDIAAMQAMLHQDGLADGDIPTLDLSL